MRRCSALPPPSAAASCRRHSAQQAASLGVCPFCLRDRLIDVQAAASADNKPPDRRRRRHDADTDTDTAHLDASSAADQLLPPLEKTASASSSLYYYYYPAPTSTTAAGSRRSGSTGSRRSAASGGADHHHHHQNTTTFNDSSLRFFNNKPTNPTAAPPDLSTLRLYGDHTDPRSLLCSCRCMQSDREHRISFHTGCCPAAASESAKSASGATATISADEYIDERYIYPISRRRSSSPARRQPAAAALAPYLQYSGAVLLDQAPFSPSFADRRTPPLTSRHSVPAGSLTSRSQNHHGNKLSGADPPPRPSLGGLRYVFHAGDVGNVPATTSPAMFHQQRRLSRASKSKLKRKNKHQRLLASSNSNNVKPPVAAANLCPLLHHHHLPPIDDRLSFQSVGRQSVDLINQFNFDVPGPFQSSTPADSCHCNVNCSPTTAGGVGSARSGSPHWLSSLFGRRKARRSKSVTSFSGSTINYKAYVMQRAAAAAAHANSAVPAAGARYSADAAAAGARNFEEEDHRFMSKFPSLFTMPDNVVTKEVMDQLNVSPPPPPPPATIKKPAMAPAPAVSLSCTATVPNSHNKKLLDFLRVDTRDAHISKCGRIDHPQPPATELVRQSGHEVAGGVDLPVGAIPPTNFYAEQKTALPERSRSPVAYRPCNPADDVTAATAASIDGTQAYAASDRILSITGARDRRNICFSGIRRDDQQHVTFTASTTILPKTDVKSSSFVVTNADKISAAPPPNASSSANALSVQTALRSWGRSLNKKLFLGRRWSSSTRASTPTTTGSNSSSAAAAATAASRSLGKSDLAMHNIEERLVLHNSIDPSDKRSSRSDESRDSTGGGGTGGGNREAPPAAKDREQSQQQTRQSSLLNIRDYSAFSFYFSHHGHLAQSRGGGNPVVGDAVNCSYGTYDDDSGILTTMSTPEQVVVVPSHEILFQSRHSVDGSSRRL